MATYPNAVVRFHASDMILRSDTNASYLTEKKALNRAVGCFSQVVYLKMCVGAPNWPNTCKVQHFKICCRFCCRSRNRRMFCDRKIFYHSTKHIRINGPPTAYYTSMHGQYNSLCNLKQYNQTTAITVNEYVIFLDS